ncbi:MAG: carbohydrate kinase family protein, partial [Thermomicrobiales bacterium]
MSSNDGAGRPNGVLSGSLAFDYIMTFPGSFKDHILPDKVHVLSVSFLFDSLKRLRGGIAGNIAYNLALLGERPAVVGAGGADFGEYRAALKSVGVDTSGIVDVDDLLTGSSFMQADQAGNQLAGFFPGASVAAGDLSVTEPARHARYGLVGATTLEAMRRHAEEIADAGCRLIYDPSQQIVAAPAEDIVAGIARAWAVTGSDYEFAMMERKTGLTVADIAAKVPLAVVTLAGEGSNLYVDGRRIDIPVVIADQVVDPTGGGDAYRAGLIKGLLLELPLEVAGRMGALAATYAIERYGTQEHRYDAD